MNHDERIKKKVGITLTKWKVSDEEKIAFLKDLEEEIAKPDEEEDLENVAEQENEVEEESPNEEVGEEEVEEQEVSEDAEEPAEPEPTEPVEETTEEPVVEEQPEVQVEEPMEEVPTEQPVEQPQTDDPRFEEMSNTIQGLTDRLASLEDIVKKLGTPVEENIGVEPHNPSGESLQESELDRYNKLRMGR